MDSKVVNKLIRAEVWPLLRRQGFSKFNSRNAWRYREPLVDVVNFQSFNSYLAEGIGCTTYSFALNLGIYVFGSEVEERIKKDSDGRLMPQEYECCFREHLKKRSQIDRFERDDIFFVDPEGYSAAAVFNEVQYLLRERAPGWYAALGNLDAVIAWMTGGPPPPGLPEGLGPGVIANGGSYSGNDLLARLRLLKHAAAPTKESALVSLRDIDAVVGSIQDIFSPLLHTPVEIETRAKQTAGLLRRLQEWMPAYDVRPSVLREEVRLFGSAWTANASVAKEPFESAACVSARKEIWPTLRQHGFSEFTERLAHRPAVESVHILAFTPVRPGEERRRGRPPVLFRLGAGVFWPKLAKGGSIRCNRRGEPRPKLEECQLQMWLVSNAPDRAVGPTVFSSTDDALRAFGSDGLAWFSVCQSPEALAELLENPNWKIFANYPTLRGQGSSRSVQQLLLRAMLAQLRRQREAVHRHLEQARAAVEECREHEQPHYRRWLEGVTANIT